MTALLAFRGHVTMSVISSASFSISSGARRCWSSARSATRLAARAP